MSDRLGAIGGVSLTNLETARALSGAFDAVISFADAGEVLGFTARRHLVLRISDICEPAAGRQLARSIDIQRMLQFSRQYPDRLLVHCHHGISRSSAAALSILADRWQPGRNADALRAVLALQPLAIPNRHIVALADELIKQDGLLLGVLDTWRAAQPWAQDAHIEVQIQPTQGKRSMADMQKPVILDSRNVIAAKVSRPIPAPVERVFAYLADATNDREWIGVLAETRRLDTGPIVTGSTFEQTAVSPTGRATVTWQIREFEPMRRIFCESIGGDYRFTGGYGFEPRGAATLVTKYATFERRGLLLAVPRILGNSLMRRYFEDWLKNLAARRW